MQRPQAAPGKASKDSGVKPLLHKARKDQNINFKPNWTRRPGCEVWICPTLGLFTSLDRQAKVGVSEDVEEFRPELKVFAFGKVEILERGKIPLLHSRPLTMLRPALPY